jgi:hypothetical protein
VSLRGVVRRSNLLFVQEMIDCRAPSGLAMTIKMHFSTISNYIKIMIILLYGEDTYRSRKNYEKLLMRTAIKRLYFLIFIGLTAPIHRLKK